ncbi:MAG: NAD(P)-binding domain-containing protein [Candidatus Obscuribacterales bacterium]|nr:NAD(P)-binding domain-containing protein [Candidatus Obscuribacterales bacterium]
MRIGIVGSGFIGKSLANLAVKQSYQVMISNSRGPETLTGIAYEIGCQSGTVEEAVSFGDVVVVAIPLKNIFQLTPEMFEGKIVIDANNYYPHRDGQIAELDEHRNTTSGLLARHLPQAKVVKALNAILAKDLTEDGRPSGAPERRALPIAGDDKQAKEVVSHLVDQLGFDVVDAGPLSESWRFERAKPAYCIPLDPGGLISALAKAERTVELPDGSWRTKSS